MKINLLIKTLLLLAVSSGLGVAVAEAAMVSSLLDASSPTWDRRSDRTGFPDSANNGLPYQVLEIKSATSTTLTATITAPTQFDSFLALYASAGFSPTSPATNLLAADDDSGTYPHASLTKSGLSANTSYYLVVTSYSSQPGSVYPQYGNYTLTLSGDWRVVTPNFAPALGGVFTTSGAINDTATMVPFGGVTVADANGDLVSLTITYPAANGTLTGTGLSGPVGNYTLTNASATTVTSNLQGLVFHPTINQVPPGSTVVSNFTLTPSDVNGPGAGDATSKVTVTSINDAPINSVLPAISGTALVGNLLTATSGTWGDVDPGASLSYSYQWYRADDSGGTGEAPIPGATANSRTLTTTDAHKFLRVVVTANDGQGSNTQTATSSRTAITNSAPANSVLPAISGTAKVGNLLSVTSGTWSDGDGDTLTYSYQWYRANDGAGTGEVAISGATANTYTVAASDAHKYLRVLVTVNDSHGSSTQDASSARTAISNSLPVLGGIFTTNGMVNDNATIPPFSGVMVIDADMDPFTVNIVYPAANGTLTSSSGPPLSGVPGNYSLPPAPPVIMTAILQGVVFTPTANQVAPGLTVETIFALTPIDPFGSGSADSTTRVTAVSINDAPAFTGTPAITGNPVPNYVLSLSATETSDADRDPVTLSYQWRTASGNITGAIGSTYLLTLADVGKSVTCVVTANDGHGLPNSTVTATTAGVTILADGDGDGVADIVDNCPAASNPDQKDANSDGVGDACDFASDSDNDGVSDGQEVINGTNPLVSDNGSFNPDGDFISGSLLDPAVNTPGSQLTMRQLLHFTGTVAGTTEVLAASAGGAGAIGAIRLLPNPDHTFSVANSDVTGITANDQSISVSADTNKGNNRLALEINGKKGNGMDNATLQGGYVFTELHDASVSTTPTIATRRLLLNFNGNGGVAYTTLADSTGGTASGSEAYSVLNDGTLTFPGASGFVSLDGEVIMAVDTTVADPAVDDDIYLGVGVRKGANMRNANLHGEFVYYEMGYEALTWTSRSVYTFNGKGGGTMVRTADSDGQTFTTPERLSYHVATDGTVSIGGQVLGTLSANGQYLVLADTDWHDANLGIFMGIGVKTAKVVSEQLGLFRQGNWYLDLNNNGHWDVGSDETTGFGLVPGDKGVVGDWDGSGFSKRGVYRGGTWYFDMNGNGKWDGTPTDKVITGFGTASDTPVVGDWNGDGITEIGFYRPSTNNWYLDWNGDGAFLPIIDRQTKFGQPGDLPVVGDWTGSGRDRIGLFRNISGLGNWYLDLNGNGVWDSASDRTVKFGQPGDQPVAGDWGGTGVDCLGIYRQGNWYLDLNGSGVWEANSDKQMGKFGQPADNPVVGNW